MKRKILAAILTMSMMVSLMPTMAFAQEAAETTVDATAAADTTATEPQAEPENNGGNVARVGDQEYPTLQAAIGAAQSGATVQLINDMTINNPIVIDKKMTLDMNGKKIVFGGDAGDEKLENGYLNPVSGADLIITGNGCVDYNAQDSEENRYRLGISVIASGNAKVTIKNGLFHAGLTAVQIQDSVVCNIEGGTFKADSSWNGCMWILNMIDSDTKTAKFNVTGGAFEKFDPSNADTENPKINFVADGYEAIKNGETWTVQKIAVKSADVATAHLHDISGVLSEDKLFDENSYKVTATEKEVNNFDVKIEATGLRTHQGGPGMGNWIGFSVKAPKGATGYKWKSSWTPSGLSSDAQTNGLMPNVAHIEDNSNYDGVATWINVTSENKAKPLYCYLQWVYGNNTSDVVSFVVDTSMVTLAETNKAEVAPAAPKVDLAGDIANNQMANKVKDAINATDSKFDVTGSGVVEAATLEASKNQVTQEEAKAKLEIEIGESINKEVHVVVQHYMDIQITKADKINKTFSVDITPKVQKVATTAEKNNEIKLDGEDKNAVKLGTPVTLKITSPVTITMPLPDEFCEKDNSVYITHKGHVYTGKAVSDNNKLTVTFKNPHGFSEFNFSVQNPTVAKVGTDEYTTVKAAVEAATSNQIVEIIKAPSENDKTYNVDSSVKNLIVKNTTSADITITVNGTQKTIEKNGGTILINKDSSSSGGGTSTSYAIVVADSDHGTLTVSRDHAYRGNVVTVTAKPDKDYVVDQVTVTDKNGDAITLTDKGDGQYTFKMPASKVDVKATFKKAEACDGGTACPSYQLKDVDKNAWYHGAVDYVVQQGLMGGTSATTFEPNTKTSRAMIVTILYRLENEPDVTVDNGFADVKKGQWYSDAISWAAANDIVNGYSDTQFGPNDSITREQMAAILYNYINYKGYDATASTDLDQYVDASQTSDWALESLKWANATGLITGTSDVTIAPKGDATRAQVAAMLMRFCETVEK